MAATHAGKLEVDPVCQNVVLVGRTGAGKSCLGNLILGRDAFEEGCFSVSTTKDTSPVEIYKQGSKQINVVDTIGIGDTDMPRDIVLARIAQVIERFPDGIGLILFVFDGKMSEHEVLAFKLLTQVLFPNCLDNVWLVRNRFKFAGDWASCNKDKAYLYQNTTSTGDIARSIADSHIIHVPNIDEDNRDAAAHILRANILFNSSAYLPPAYKDIYAAIHGKSQNEQAKAIDELVSRTMDTLASNDLLRLAWKKWKQSSLGCTIL